MDVCKQVGANLRRLRQARGWSQEELGFESGVHRTYISDLERGTRNPSLTLLWELSQALGVRLTELVDLDSSPDRRGEPRRTA
ncbi:MAG TPA: helix-turn-helix transcriptional regulator [Azospirillaceae bacterium]|nr:helix-turn-helix transcriptional regulator [Azospirillaceae bacterium]